MSAGSIVTNVTVVDGTGGPARPGVDVIVRNGRFHEIRPAGRPAEADLEVFDGSGRYLLPGLWESHTHLRAREPMTPEVGAARLDGLLAEYRAAGITGVIELGGPIDIDTAFRARRSGETAPASAELFFAGPSFTGIDGWPLHLHHNHTLVREVRDAASARALLEAVLDAGTDIVKIIYDGERGAPDKLPAEALPALVELAHSRGRRVVVHIHDAEDIVDALGAGADGIEHTYVAANGRAEAQRIAELFARTGAAFTPTLAVFEQIGRSSERAYLEELARDGIIAADAVDTHVAGPAFDAPFPHHPADECLRRLEHGFMVLAEMRKAGVKIVAGSDVALFMARPAALLRELQLLARAGLSAGEILVSATKNAAEKVGRAADVGTIAAGKIADAVLVDADPQTDIQHLVEARHRVATMRAGTLQQAKMNA